MLFDDTYNEINKNSSAIYKDKGSKFIAYLFSVYNNTDIKKKLEEVKKKEPSANHYCYAYVLHPDKSLYRMNDDGEPSSTAGRQIFNEIKKLELTNILIIVVRYFGGTKLGIPGLIKAYKTVSSIALGSIEILKKNIEEEYKIEFDHQHMNHVVFNVAFRHFLSDRHVASLLNPTRASSLCVDSVVNLYFLFF